MEKLAIKLVLVTSLVLSFGCDTKLDLEREPLNPLHNNWQFNFIRIDDEWHSFVNEDFEPPLFDELWIGWYWVEYNEDNFYDFRTDLLPTEYGTNENYQPGYGTYQYFPEEMLLIHNPGMPYEVSYNIIELSDTMFIREYERIIQVENFDSIPIGTSVTYREVLIPREIYYSEEE